MRKRREMDMAVDQRLLQRCVHVVSGQRHSTSFLDERGASEATADPESASWETIHSRYDLRHVFNAGKERRNRMRQLERRCHGIPGGSRRRSESTWMVSVLC